MFGDIVTHSCNATADAFFPSGRLDAMTPVFWCAILRPSSLTTLDLKSTTARLIRTRMCFAHPPSAQGDVIVVRIDGDEGCLSDQSLKARAQ